MEGSYRRRRNADHRLQHRGQDHGWRGVADLGVPGHRGDHGDSAEAAEGPGVSVQGHRHQQGGKIRAQRGLQAQDGEGG